MKNLRKRINVRFVNNKKDFLKNTSRPIYVTHKIFNKILLLFMKLNQY